MFPGPFRDVVDGAFRRSFRNPGVPRVGPVLGFSLPAIPCLDGFGREFAVVRFEPSFVNCLRGVADSDAYWKTASCSRKSCSRGEIPEVPAAKVVAKWPTMTTPAFALVMATLRRFASSVKPTLPVAFARTREMITRSASCP